MITPCRPGSALGPEGASRIVSTGSDPLLNRLLDGRYRLGQPIGRGGMGVVYRAVDTKLERLVAVKLLTEAGAANKERFAREVQALARLTHPNLVRLLDAELGVLSYLVMDLIGGTNLARRLAHDPVSPEAAARIGTGVASALAYVHSQGIVHRDVKPANVIVDQNGKAYLTDFGIARLLGTNGMTATGLAIGTAAYLAPEQLRGTEVGPKADVYALGLVLIECLNGRPPFEGTDAEVLAARLYRDPPVPTAVSRSWRDLLALMTAAAPADRPCADYVAESLSRTVFGNEAMTRTTDNNATALLRPVGTLPPKGRGKRAAHRRLHQFLAGLLAATAIVLALVLNGAYSAPPHRSPKWERSTTGSTPSTTLPTSTRLVPSTTVAVSNSPTTRASITAPTTITPTSTGPAGSGPAGSGPSGTGPTGAGPIDTATNNTRAAGTTVPRTLEAPGGLQNSTSRQQGDGSSGFGGTQGGGHGNHYGRAFSRHHVHDGVGSNGVGQGSDNGQVQGGDS
jgi:serine/threonine protein kinase